MQKEYSAKSLEEALEAASAELGVSKEELKYQKLSENSFLGLFKSVKILVSVPEKKEIKKEEPAAEVKKTSGKSAVRQGENESDNMLELLNLLKEGPMSPSDLSEKSKRPFKWVASTLIILEVSGKVKLMPDGKYSVN